MLAVSFAIAPIVSLRTKQTIITLISISTACAGEALAKRKHACRISVPGIVATVLEEKHSRYFTIEKNDSFFK